MKLLPADYSLNSLSTEILAGVTSFLATAYIVVVNPSILAQAGMPFSGVLTATVLVCFFSSLMMGVYARNPYVVAPGMGLNAFFTFTVVKGMQIPYTVALGAVFWSGVFFLLISVFNVRVLIVQAIPKSLRYGVAAGIGLFITLIGLSNAYFIVSNPATLLSVGPLTPGVLIFLAGLALTAFLIQKKVTGAVLWGIVITSLIASTQGRLWGEETLIEWKGFFAAPDFSLLFALDLKNSLSWSMAPIIFAFVFTDLFDSVSTFVGLAEASGRLDAHGEPLQLKESLLTDAVSTTIAGLVGSSPGTAYVESAVGIEAGGKTGLTAITAALCFLPCLFLSPILSIIPSVATAPALVLVGVFMIPTVLKINWDTWHEAVPAYLAMVLIPFTYSITQGIIWGFLSYAFLKIAAGKVRDISLSLWLIIGLSILALILE
ncbi:MAG: NCS2 family permease [Siphonobacter sp.]